MDDFAETASGNRISKSARIKGSDNILISGYTTISANVQLNGDVRLAKVDSKATLQLGKFVFLDQNVTVTPSLYTNSSSNGSPLHRTSVIGSYVMIGKNTNLKSTRIGSRVIIGENCTVGNNTTIHDCVIILPNTTLPDNTNIPAFSLVFTDPQSLNQYPKTKPPSITISPLHESYKKIIDENSKLSYVNNQFTPSDIPRF